MNENEQRVFDAFSGALNRSTENAAPYRHWFLSGLIPDDILHDVSTINFPATVLDGVSGKRELHNDHRHYFDRENLATYSGMAAIAGAFQSSMMISRIEHFFGTKIEGTFLRIEYAIDQDGFWLEPHTDLGVKKLTVLIYMADEQTDADLGTDIFDGEKKWAARTPFRSNTALAFVPGDNTYHGFVKRPFSGVRKSLILNYVTTEWRAREQLAFPEATVTAT